MDGSKATSNSVTDFLYALSPSQWKTLAETSQFAGFTDTLNSTAKEISHVQNFFGLNIADQPLTYIKAAFVGGSALLAIVAILIPILAWATQTLSIKLMPQAAQQSGDSQQDAMMNSMKTMNMVMPLMSAVFCFTFPVGLGIYWVTSALFQCLQQVIINKYMDNADIDALVAKNKEKAAKKKAKGQKTFMERLMDTSAKADAAKEEIENPTARKTIKQIASINTKKIAGPEGTGAEDYANLDSVDISKLGEIGKKAYLVSQYEKEHGHTRGGKK